MPHFVREIALFILLFPNLNLLLTAQPDGFAFAETLRSGEGRLDEASYIVRLPDGDFIVGGEFRGLKDFDPGIDRVVRSTPSTSTTNPYIARYTAGGQMVWVRQIRASSQAELRGLDIDADGNIYVLGSFNSLLYVDETDLTQVLTDNPQPNADLWVASYTPSGALRWAEMLGGDAVDSGTALVVNGNQVVLCGVFGQTLDIDPGAGVFELSTNGENGQLSFVASYDKDTGAFDWGFQIGGVVFFDLIHAITRDELGNLYITGAFRQVKDFDPSPDSEFLLSSDGSNDDLFVASYTATGEFRWARRAGDGGADFGRGIGWSNGTVYVTGEFRFTAVFEGELNSETLVSAGNQDAFVALYHDSTGELLDAFGIGSTGNDSGESIQRIGDQLIVCGHYSATVDFNPNGTAQEFTATSFNGFLASYDPADLNLDWMSDVQSLGVSYVSDFVVYDGLVRSVGKFTNETDFDPSPADAIVVPVRTNDSDFFLADYTVSTGAFQQVFVGEDQPGGNDDVSSVAALTNGGVVVAGSTEGRLFFEDGSSLEVDGNGAFLARFGEDGELLSTASFQAGTSAFISSVKTDAADNLYVSAYFTGDAAFDHAGGVLNLAANANQSRMLLLKFNTNLELIWHREFTGTLLQVASDVAVHPDRVVLTGFFRGETTLAPGVVLSSNGTTDGFVASFLPDGSLEWGFSFGSTSLDSGERIGFDASGNILLAAQIRFTVNMDPTGTADPLVGSGSNSLVMASYSPAGAYLWSHLQSGANTVRSIASLDANRFVTYGTFSGSVTLGSPLANQSLNSLGSTDVYVGIFDNSGNADTLYVVAGGPGTDEAGQLAVEGNTLHFSGWVRSGGSVFSGGLPVLESALSFANGFYAAISAEDVWSDGFLMSGESNTIEPAALSIAAQEVYVGGRFTVSFGERYSFTGGDAFVGRLGEAFSEECVGDLDGDGLISTSDLVFLLAEFGCVASCPADLNGDDQTNVADLILILSLFGTACN